jgi:hypothetical protein
MPSWLAIMFGRLALGERFRKATSADYRIAFGHFFFLPVVMSLGSTAFFRHFFDQAGVVAIWSVLTVAGVVYLFGLILLWAKFIPASVSFALAVVAWAGFAYISWQH